MRRLCRLAEVELGRRRDEAVENLQTGEEGSPGSQRGVGGVAGKERGRGDQQHEGRHPKSGEGWSFTAIAWWRRPLSRSALVGGRDWCRR